ncbi:hypothetical protein LOY28_14835 [Pseudomonas sp. B21-017]|uniref:8-oxoguanine DNA glycosylase OGG fold protein n=1 Tax=Pseudomonas sp. B21-017 TaxID=2895474 RepID=UPI00215EB3AE|nr:hypothetical protein [Pseudomonas sp. B21-017]UVM36025.1 hypothetical protein LOY28_14835 [Pseudomonas sp. B21-017]
MRFPIVHTELSIFLSSYSTPLIPWVGKSPNKWLSNVGSLMAHHVSVPAAAPSRKTLYSLWSSNAPTEVCALVTLAWGGMRASHGRTLMVHMAHWIKICDDLRNGKHTRRSAYDAFMQLRTAGLLPGMGPAYFTKLIHFAYPKANGYILDQWTARSVHTLTDQDGWPAVQVSAGSKSMNPAALRIRVVDRVSALDYEDYCVWIDGLAAHLRITGAVLEERLFSSGGKAPHGWRKHLLTSWHVRHPKFY